MPLGGHPAASRAARGRWRGRAPLTAHAVALATPLYNLRVDGDHTDVANEWLVHNNFH